MNTNTTNSIPLQPSIKLSAGLKAKIVKSIEVITQAFQQYPDSLAISFNGGKDSTVLLDLVIKCGSYLKQTQYLRPFYISTGKDFDEITQFINTAQNHWNINILKMASIGLKDGLSQVMGQYGVKALFLGVRSSDVSPLKLNYFERTTEGWPDAMRVMPLLNWSYKDIWEYIDALTIPVCDLYSKGYTSIGSSKDTKPNIDLYDPEKGIYKHARCLKDEHNERNGRNTGAQ